MNISALFSGFCDIYFDGLNLWGWGAVSSLFGSQSFPKIAPNVIFTKMLYSIYHANVYIGGES